MSPRRTQRPPAQAPSEPENAKLGALEPYAAYLSRPLPAVAADLERFATLLIKWNTTYNLVSRETLGELWPRHIEDSLQLLPLIRPSDVVLLDLGSGGGFPAVPLAIALRRTHILVEPIGKKASFLKAVSRELGLDLKVETSRAENLGDLPPVDVMTSRALARLHNLLPLLARFWGPATRAILHKGREYSEELAESRAEWQYDVLVTQSRTDPSGVLLVLSNLSRK
jgi:16S rRNA (guanine527-N7)-methyltransferase